MDLQLNGKTALVLAASKGLGKACAAALAAEGVDVVIGARGPDALNTAAEEIRALGKGRVLAIPVDVLQPQAAAAIVDATVTAFGKIDILVNNAGGPPSGNSNPSTTPPGNLPSNSACSAPSGSAGW